VGVIIARRYAINRGCRAYQPVVARGSDVKYVGIVGRRSARARNRTVQQREALANDRGCRPMITATVIPCACVRRVGRAHAGGTKEEGGEVQVIYERVIR